MGIAASEKAEPPKTRVQEVACDQPGVRVFVCHSDERMAYERGEREKSMRRVREELEALDKRVKSGKLKAPEKIGASASRILGRNHGYRYYDWELQEGKFRFFEHTANLKQEEMLEGKYIIQSEEKNLSAIEAVRIYKELSEVERAFSGLKDVIEMRPIYHQRAQRMEAHIFVASLAFLLDRALEKKLKSAASDISSKEAWELLKTVRVVDIDLGAGQQKRSVTQGSARAARILKNVGITNLDPNAVKAKNKAA
jgi:transposase